MKTLLVAIALMLSGCAVVQIETEGIKYTSVTVLKDIAIDPNGIVSTTNPETDNILTALGTGVGFWLGMMF